METLLQGRQGHLPATPALQMPSLRCLLHLSSPTQHNPQPSRPWGRGWESPLCPAEQQQRRRASLLLRARFPLSSSRAEGNCPALSLSGRWRAQLGQGKAFPSARLPLPLPLSARPSLYFAFLLHLPVLKFSF